MIQTFWITAAIKKKRKNNKKKKQKNTEKIKKKFVSFRISSLILHSMKTFFDYQCQNFAFNLVFILMFFQFYFLNRILRNGNLNAVATRSNKF